MADNAALINVPKLAEILGKSSGAIYRSYQDLGIPYIKVGGSVRFRQSSVDAWLADREAESLTDEDARRALRTGELGRSTNSSVCRPQIRSTTRRTSSAEGPAAS